MSHERIADAGKQVVDLLSVGTVVATIASFLPPIAALFSIVWTGIRIYETPTCQGWVQSWRNWRSRS